jgi:hypothetical protein
VQQGQRREHPGHQGVTVHYWGWVRNDDEHRHLEIGERAALYETYNPLYETMILYQPLDLARR